ncbi:phosphatidylcholine and lysophosphatidylcholine phospholipase, partial [Ascosphaera atra]
MLSMRRGGRSGGDGDAGVVGREEDHNRILRGARRRDGQVQDSERSHHDGGDGLQLTRCEGDDYDEHGDISLLNTADKNYDTRDSDNDNDVINRTKSAVEAHDTHRCGLDYEHTLADCILRQSNADDVGATLCPSSLQANTNFLPTAVHDSSSVVQNCQAPSLSPTGTFSTAFESVTTRSIPLPAGIRLTTTTTATPPHASVAMVFSFVNVFIWVFQAVPRLVYWVVTLMGVSVPTAAFTLFSTNLTFTMNFTT